MTEIANITQLGNPILRQQAAIINNPREENIQAIIKQLMVTVKAANGVGIAAPQIGQSYRLFIVASHPNPRYPHAPLMEPTAMINPKITDYSGKKVKDWEGCLSIPGIRGLVPRYHRIEFEYLAENGKLVKQVLEGFLARIVQHELDHLNGVLFIDRLESLQDMYSEAEYQKRISY